MPWKFQCLEGDGTWVDFDTDANVGINEVLLNVHKFNERERTGDPNLHCDASWTVWSKNENADKLDYYSMYTGTTYTMNFKTMVRSQIDGNGTPCMVRGLWGDEEPLSGKRKRREEPGKPFVWEEYLDAMREQQMRLSQKRIASHAKAPPPSFVSQ